MNNDEIFGVVRQINTLVNNAQKNINEANATIKESLPLLKELLDNTRKQSTQTSLDEFAIKKGNITAVKDVSIVAKESAVSKLISERLTLEDIRKMLEGD
jgi:NAD kinase